MAAEILAFFFSWGLGVSGGDSLSVFVLFLAGVCGPEALLDAGVVDVASEVFPPPAAPWDKAGPFGWAFLSQFRLVGVLPLLESLSKPGGPDRSSSMLSSWGILGDSWCTGCWSVGLPLVPCCWVAC